MLTMPALRPLQQMAPPRPGLLLQKAKQPTSLATAINTLHTINIKPRTPSTAHRIHTGNNISSSSGLSLNLAAMATPAMMPSMGMVANTHTRSSSSNSSMVRQGSNLEP